MNRKIDEKPIILVNSKKNLRFFINKCHAEFKTSPIIELNAIGNATGMLIKVIEEMARTHGSRVKSLVSLGFHDRKQYKKRKLKLIARLERFGNDEVLEKETLEKDLDK